MAQFMMADGQNKFSGPPVFIDSGLNPREQIGNAMDSIGEQLYRKTGQDNPENH
ncbi:MAG: hypothetical protein K9G39_01595 [Chlorobium sp.]|uniref:hypothetical protein n=1 Tax=Chlorobium sp. TaxID=1095 RepID=UPI0025C12E91|nr:hypothetical protein [Chlorobium sp.]MCF8382277.1 hypothetical protein [Chlorobium sp.]